MDSLELCLRWSYFSVMTILGRSSEPSDMYGVLVRALPQLSYLPRQAPLGWRLTSSLPASGLSPKPRFGCLL